MEDDFKFEPAPVEFRKMFNGQALSHLDEIVISWRMGGHPICWEEMSGLFQIHVESGKANLFRLHAPCEGKPARIEVDSRNSCESGVPSDLVSRLWEELAFIGKLVENPHVPIYVPLSKFSRGDRKVFMAYALTIARNIAAPPEI
jgi:hypothetical protein